MKNLALLLAAAGSATAAALPAGLPTYMGHPVDPQYLPVEVRRELEKRQSGLGGLISGMLNPAGYGRVPPSPGDAPAKQPLEARIPGAKTVKIRYGPYKIPSSTVIHQLSGHSGTLFNYPDKDAPKPCEECVILGMNAGLEFPDGTNANIHNGLWLHHYVHFAVGPGRNDATCAGASMSLPHMIIGSTPTASERMWSSGNERTPSFFQELPFKVGYHLRKTDEFRLIVDLMNTTPKEQLAYLTLTYDFVDGHPAGIDDIRPVWFDANNCGTSEVMPPQQSGKYTITAKPWIANLNGDVVGYAGHLHDGGVSATLFVDGKQNCVSKAAYGETPEYIGADHGHGGSSSAAASGGHDMADMEGGDAHGHDMANMEGGGATGGSAIKHISSMGMCQYPLPVQKIQSGQQWVLKADYDYSVYDGVLDHNGKQSSVMSIAIMFVRVPPGEATAGKYKASPSPASDSLGGLLGGIGGGGGIGAILGGLGGGSSGGGIGSILGGLGGGRSGAGRGGGSAGLGSSGGLGGSRGGLGGLGGLGSSAGSGSGGLGGGLGGLGGSRSGGLGGLGGLGGSRSGDLGGLGGLGGGRGGLGGSRSGGLGGLGGLLRGVFR